MRYFEKQSKIKIQDIIRFWTEAFHQTFPVVKRTQSFIRTKLR